MARKGACRRSLRGVDRHRQDLARASCALRETGVRDPQPEALRARAVMLWSMEVTATARKRDAENGELPPCYGLYWEAVGDSPCTKCDARRSCLHAFATLELPRLQARLGDEASDLTKLASVSQVKGEALRVAIAYGSKASNEKPKERRQATTGTDADAAPAAGKKPSSKTSKRRRSRSRGSPWGKHTFKARWLRERERSPAIGKLTPGHNIAREFGGTRHTVKVLHGRYVYDGREYPTLYEVTKVITGTRSAKKQRRTAGDESTRPDGKRQLCNWSATRFFAAALAAVG